MVQGTLIKEEPEKKGSTQIFLLSFKKPLNNSSSNYSETGKKKRGPSFPHILKELSVLKMAAHPWAAGKSESIRGSLGKRK